MEASSSELFTLPRIRLPGPHPGAGPQEGIGPPPAGGVQKFGCNVCHAVAKCGGPGGLIPGYRDWLLGHGMSPLWWERSLS